ncbi:sugar ABC transporter permease [Tepidibacter formicigenes]|jgi:D-xylose transport system permease protein|uniref:Xylose transport system permease protein XylH n=1 Tax=Tepidibacter formicigenes DSM 15518 TaxID=1123349 RepID=A0A1M6NFC7_9FIRM|nr:sugar ABC transporter permease [Tepidibacter formicigenes]SHJ94402.1 xylose ABC transporter membrane protein [Tepidibacter formicigenes DSM 15518]
MSKASIKDIQKRQIDIRKYTMIIALVGIWILFSFLDKSGTFLTPRNMSNLFKQMAVTAVLAMGMFMILVDLHIDLSLGSLVGLTGGVCALLMYKLGLNPFIAIILTMALGVVCGVITGTWVNAGVPAFIASLGGMLAYRGAIMGISRGESIPISDAGFRFLGTAYVPKTLGLIIAIIACIFVVISAFKKRNARIKFGFKVKSMALEIIYLVIYVAIIMGFVLLMNSYKGIPMPIMIVLGLALILSFVATKTKFGRQVFAIGGNKEAARLSGIDIKKRTLQIFIISGLMAAIAGILLTARLGTATTDAGNGFELDAVASCVIGGTSLLGGEGTIIGAVLGALVMASIDNGMSILNTEAYWQLIVKGLILVIAVFVDIYNKKKGRTF